MDNILAVHQKQDAFYSLHESQRIKNQIELVTWCLVTGKKMSTHVLPTKKKKHEYCNF